MLIKTIIERLAYMNLRNTLIIFTLFFNLQGYSQQEPLKHFSAEIQEFHLKWITQTPGCLVTDTVEISVDRNDKESFKSLLHTELPEGHRTAHWSWDFVRNYRFHKSKEMEINSKSTNFTCHRVKTI